VKYILVFIEFFQQSQVLQMENGKSAQEQSFEVKTDSGFRILTAKDILYIQASGKFSIIFLSDQTEIIAYHLLKWFEKYLEEPLFYRCHKSFLVNCRFVDCYCNKKILLSCKKEILLSRQRIILFKENLSFLAGVKKL
jgi:DNA-binding LytR/AlgR family response regulator